MSAQDTPSAIAEIMAEVERAVAKFPTWPTDPLHAVAVLGEEFGELTKEALQLVYEPHKTSADEVRKEALQTAAMAIRFYRSLDQYEYKRGEQHVQRVDPAEEVSFTRSQSGELQAEIDRLRGEVADRNRRALEGDKATAAFNAEFERAEEMMRQRDFYAAKVNGTPLSSTRQIDLMASDALAGTDDVQEWMLHMDLHLTEHDERHAGLALRAAWPHVRAYLASVENERNTWKELAKNAESAASAIAPRERPAKPKECEGGCPPKQVCDHCQWPLSATDSRGDHG